MHLELTQNLIFIFIATAAKEDESAEKKYLLKSATGSQKI